MAAGDYLTWAVQSQDAPAHVARILQTILLNEGVVDVAGGSFEVTEDTGSNMNITVGSGTLGDLAVIEGDDTAGQGVYVIEAQNATVTKTIAASDPSDDRIDLVVLQNYDDEADSSGNNDAEVEVIEGTPAGSPSAPSLPDSAIPLAEVLVGAGVTAITDANITDTRTEAKLRSEVQGQDFELLLEVTADGSSVTLDTGTIPQTHQDLLVVFNGSHDGSVIRNASVRFNNDSGSNYRFVLARLQGDGTESTISNAGATSARVGNIGPTASTVIRINMPNYTSATTQAGLVEGGSTIAGTDTDRSAVNGWIQWLAGSAITSVQLISTTDEIASGSTMRVYGLGLL